MLVLQAITIHFVLPKCIKSHHFQVFFWGSTPRPPFCHKTKAFMQHNMYSGKYTRGPKLKLPQGPIILSVALRSTITYYTRKQIPRTTEAREQVGNATSDVAILSKNTGWVSYLPGRGLRFQAQSFSVAIETNQVVASWLSAKTRYYKFSVLVALEEDALSIASYTTNSEEIQSVHTYTHVIQNNLRTAQLAALPASWAVTRL